MRIKIHLIDDAGYERSVVANHLGVTTKAIKKWERGESEPGFYKMVKLAKLLDVDVKDLIE